MTDEETKTKLKATSDIIEKIEILAKANSSDNPRANALAHCALLHEAGIQAHIEQRYEEADKAFAKEIEILESLPRYMKA